jgi:hypothetical protein
LRAGGRLRFLPERRVLRQPTSLRILAEFQWNEGKYHPSGENRYGIYDGFVENKAGRLIELAAFGEKFLATYVGYPNGSTDSAGV